MLKLCFPKALKGSRCACTLPTGSFLPQNPKRKELLPSCVEEETELLRVAGGSVGDDDMALKQLSQTCSGFNTHLLALSQPPGGPTAKRVLTRHETAKAGGQHHIVLTGTGLRGAHTALSSKGRV